MGDVLGELATLGYDAEWHCIPAAAVGAPHRRDRVWIVGYPNSPSQPNGAINDETQIMRGSISDAMRERLERAELLRKENSQFNGIGNEGWWLIEPNVGRVAARVSSWLDDRAGVTLDGQASALARAAGITKDLARVGCMRALRQYGELGKASHQIRRSDVFSCRLSQVSQAIARRRKASEPYEAMCGLWDEISPIPFEETQDVFQSMLERVGQEECKKALGCRTARLRALGNTVVPQIPELIGRAIMQVAA
jgi:site-specific DNA-cytosine methylase